MPEKRGIRISLTYRSWRLVCEALTYVGEKPYLDNLEKYRADIGRLAHHIKSKLEEQKERRSP